MNATEDATPMIAGTEFVGNLQQRMRRQFRVQVADWQDTCRDLASWEDRNLIDGLAEVGRWAAAIQP